jgi:3-phenylpropionate/cinnamic acid dioxygenase small subunit
MAAIDHELYLRIQQYYFREARLLDERQYQQWFALLSEKIEYLVPARHVAQLDTALRETEALLNTQQEFSSNMEPPLRAENHLHLMIRAMRSFKLNAWSENPPARTRRLVSNIEVFASVEKPQVEWQVYNNTLLYYSRHEHSDALYSYQRKDVLETKGDDFCLVKREVLLDSCVITGPSVGLFF